MAAEEARQVAADTWATIDAASRLLRLQPFPLDVLTDAPPLYTLVNERRDEA
jgi:hypothetical protein